MSKEKLLKEYENELNNLVKSANSLNLTNAEAHKIFSDCYKKLYKDHGSSTKSKFNYLFGVILKLGFLSLILAIFIYILLNVHVPTSSIVLRNVQGLIYPGFTFLRFLSVPLIKQFPSLTELYYESCLVENPYFFVQDMDCWPCRNTYSVMDFTNFTNTSFLQTSMPYITKTSQKPVPLSTLKEVYNKNHIILNNESNSIISNNKINNLDSLFNTVIAEDFNILWRINKMSSARIIRKLFPRPEMVSEWSGQSIERFIIIDGSKSAPYSLPNMECSYISVMQAFGTRTIVLKPSKECLHECKTVSITLNPSYILWYNWWYWRPISLPSTNSSDISISYVSSFC